MADVHAPSPELQTGLLTGQQGALIELLRSKLPELASVPLPASGRTWSRWTTLRSVAHRDLSLARLTEGHLDARAILAEFDRDDVGSDAGLLWAVWAAQPTDLLAIPKGAGWRLRGTKAWCSGSQGIDRALVTATTEEGPRLFVIDPREVTFDPASWHPLGMQGSASHTGAFDCVVEADAAVGTIDAYTQRPGFGHGGAGVAACWLGGARRLIEDIVELAPTDPVILAELGSCRAQFDAALSHLERSAFDIDERPRDPVLAENVAASVRLVSATACRSLLDFAFGAVGSEGLCHRPALQQHLVDLVVYVSQLPRHRAAAAHALSDVPWE